MIKDANRYYGSAISTIIDALKYEIRIKNISYSAAGFYLINNSLPMYIKYSTSRRGPWCFNFLQAHQEYQQHLFQQFGECVMTFVCGKDGIAALTHENFRSVLDGSFDTQESVTIRRRHNEMYRVRGKDGALEKCVPRSSLVDILKQKIQLERELDETYTSISSQNGT